LEVRLNTYPTSEQSIPEIERGRSSNVIVPMIPDKTPSPGDLVLFALASSPAGQEACFVKDGDSVCVLLTDVTALDSTDPATGLTLFRLSWTPLGQQVSPAISAKRVVRSSHPRARRT
jgi:hypothetical protein